MAGVSEGGEESRGFWERTKGEERKSNSSRRAGEGSSRRRGLGGPASRCSVVMVEQTAPLAGRVVLQRSTCRGRQRGSQMTIGNDENQASSKATTHAQLPSQSLI